MYSKVVDWERLAEWRGLAALLVAVGHAVQLYSLGEAPLIRAGSALLAQASVMMFFAISGYSIAAAAQRSLTTPSPSIHYALRRATRILPPLWFALALTALLYVLAPLVFPSGTTGFLPAADMARPAYSIDLWAMLGAATFVNGFLTATPSANGPLWSLSYEVWLYAIYFLALLTWQRRKVGTGLLAVLLFVALVMLDNVFKYLLFLKYSAVWFAGAFAFHLRDTDKWMPAAQAFVFPIRIVTIVVSGLICVCFALRVLNGDLGTGVVSWFNLSFGVLCSVCLNWMPERFPQEGISASRLRGLSNYGYTLYLVHFPVLLFAFGWGQRYLIEVPLLAIPIALVALVLSILLARTAALLVENRAVFIGLLQRHGVLCSAR